VRPTDVQDRDSAPELLKSLCAVFRWLRHGFADVAYGGNKLQGELAKTWRVDDRDRQAIGCCERLCLAAATMDG